MILSVAAAQLRVGLPIGANIDRICQRVAECAGQVDVVVFPECSTIGYDATVIDGNEDEIQAGIHTIRREVANAGCYAVVGTPTFRGGKTYNSSLLIGPDGKVACRYDKVHVWPGRESNHFVPGKKIALADVRGVPVTMLICADFFYPELTRLPTLLGAKLILHSSGFAGDPTMFSFIDEIGRQGFPHIRAVENQAFFIHSDYCGSYRDGRRYAKGATKIIHPCGSSIVEAVRDKEDLIVARIDTEIPPPVDDFKKRLLETSFLAPVWKKLLAASSRFLT
jgi:predicted amidohydrolase